MGGLRGGLLAFAYAALLSTLVAVLQPSAILAADAAPAVREYTIEKKSFVALPVPEAWRQKIEQKGSAPPLTVTFSVPKDKSWEFLVSALWRPDVEGPEFEDRFVRATVESSGMRALYESVETKIDLKEVSGAAAKGYYFRVTDKREKLPADEYKYMLQGMVGLGSVGLTFTLFSNTDDAALVEQALKIVEGATVGKRP